MLQSCMTPATGTDFLSPHSRLYFNLNRTDVFTAQTSWEGIQCTLMHGADVLIKVLVPVPQYNSCRYSGVRVCHSRPDGSEWQQPWQQRGRRDGGDGRQSSA